MTTQYLNTAIREGVGNVSRELRILLQRPPQPRNCWLFLVGCYNSGTTLLAKLLAQHPDISAIPTEGHFITDQFVKDYEVGLPRMWVGAEHLFRLTEEDNGPDVTRIKKEWAIRLDTSKPVFLEKSPPNSARTLWLQANFKPAKFVAIIRDGYAVAEGIRRKADPKHLPASWPIEQCAHQWARSNQVLLEDSSRLQDILWVRYEELAGEPQKVLNSIVDFLGLSPFPAMQTNRSLPVHERDEPLRDMNEESIDRLNPEEIATITRVAGEMLTRFGYPLR